MSVKVYIYGLCNVFYDAYYIQGINELYENYEFNVSKFPDLEQGTFAFIVENNNQSKRIIVDSRDSSQIDVNALEWCNIYGKINYNEDTVPHDIQNKILAIGPSFGVKIWNLGLTFFYMISNLIKFRKRIQNRRDFIANYWRQYKRFRLNKYNSGLSSTNEVFFMNSIWKQEAKTNNYRSLFIKACRKNDAVYFEGGFAARKDGNNLGFDELVCSKRISLKRYIQKTKQSAFVFNTPAVLSCHGWKLAEFSALGKAIITTAHYNKLPADLINDKHVIYALTQNEIERAVEKLIVDTNYKRNLELEVKKYFDDYLAPKKVIERLADNIQK